LKSILSEQKRYLETFATFLPRVKDFNQDDLPKRNSAIFVALSNSNDEEKSINMLVPLALPMLFEAKFTLDSSWICHSFLDTLSPNCVRLIHEYVVRLPNSNPDFRRDLLIRISDKFDMKA
jgi:hypothetical protein